LVPSGKPDLWYEAGEGSLIIESSDVRFLCLLLLRLPDTILPVKNEPLLDVSTALSFC